MSRSSIRGFSLVELMLSLVLGLIVTSVMIASFNSASKSARTQNALLRILDNGRFASQYMSDELHLVGQQYCSTYANISAYVTPYGLTPRSSLLINVNNAALLPKWLPAPPVGGTTPYEVDPGVFIRGYKCGASTCTPALPTSANDINVVPAVGTTVGSRAANTDVLTVRYLLADGVTIAADLNATDTVPVSLPSAATGAPLNFSNGNLAMIANCNTSEVFATTAAGTSLSHTTADGNYITSLAGPFTRTFDSRVFNFSKDILSVTYFIGIRNDPDTAGRRTSALMRITNGAAPEVVVDGVERLNVTYGVLDGQNRMHYLDAAQVDANAFGSTLCPPLKMTTSAPPTAGCLWRGVSSVEVSMLVNSVQDSDEAGEPFRYSPDGTAVQSLAATATLPNGLPAGRMKRREFRFVANLHSVSR